MWHRSCLAYVRMAPARPPIALVAALAAAGAFAPTARAAPLEPDEGADETVATEGTAAGHGGDQAGGGTEAGHGGAPAAGSSGLRVEHHAHRGGTAFRIIAGTSRAYADNDWVFGFGLAGELRVAPHWELVLGTALLLGENSEVLPIELLLKHIVTIEDRVSFHVAAGPLAAIVFERGHETLALFGGTANVGFTFWQTESFGLLVEAAYQLLAEQRAVHDIEGSVGVSWRH